MHVYCKSFIKKMAQKVAINVRNLWVRRKAKTEKIFGPKKYMYRYFFVTVQQNRYFRNW